MLISVLTTSTNLPPVKTEASWWWSLGRHGGPAVSRPLEIIVKLRQGSGKVRQGKARKGKDGER